jgi:Flp pilus assembly protein TadD
MISNAMDSFTLSTEGFDVSLLPEEARVVGSPEFQSAVSRFFESQFLEMGVNGQVVVTPETIRVTWAQSGADPIEAGIEKLQRGQLKEGCQWLEALRSRFPDSEKLLQGLGIGLSELGELDRAIECLERLVELAPGNHHGRVALGVALGRQGDWIAAERQLRQVVEDVPDDVWGQKNLGGILFRQGRFAEAVTSLEKAVQLAPKDGHAWLVLGETLLALNENGRARGVLQKARTLTKGQLQDKAVVLLGQTLDALFTRDADGLRPEVVDGLVWALRVLAGICDSKARQQLVLRAYPYVELHGSDAGMRV